MLSDYNGFTGQERINGWRLVKFLISQKLIENPVGKPCEICGSKHAEILPTIPLIQNSGFLIAGRLFFPGDAFTVPNKSVEILALPVCAPWSKLSEVISYLKKVKPKIAFPVHDAILNIKRLYYHWPEQTMLEIGGGWRVIEEGQCLEF